MSLAMVSSGIEAARWIMAAIVMPAWLLLCWLSAQPSDVGDRSQRLAAGDAAPVVMVGQHHVDRLIADGRGNVVEAR